MSLKPGRMHKRGRRAVEDTNEELSDSELQTLQQTTIDFESLRPNVEDRELYDRFIAAVEESTAKNESIAQIEDRVKNLGEGGVALTKKVIGLVKSIREH